MAKISLTKIQNVLPQFVDSRLMPSAPPYMKFLLGGAVPVVLKQSQLIIKQYQPLLKSFGIVDDQHRLDIDKAKDFINAGFSKSGSIPFMGFIIDKTDGEALIGILEKYRDD